MNETFPKPNPNPWPEYLPLGLSTAGILTQIAGGKRGRGLGTGLTSIGSLLSLYEMMNRNKTPMGGVTMPFQAPAEDPTQSTGFSMGGLAKLFGIE